MSAYDPKTIEPKWQETWLETGAFRANDASDKPKYYALDMFPYPSGAGLHVGHPEGYTATDIISRKKRMEGMNVLHPMGWDAFGLPAENYAIKTKIHPDTSTHANIENFRRQIQSLGFSYDWEREFATCDAEYYRWTQWWFLFLYRQGLAYKKNAPVNWCESCKTVLANEQVENGACERCKNDVVQKNMNQWFFKITDFVDDQVWGRVKPGSEIRSFLMGGRDIADADLTQLGVTIVKTDADGDRQLVIPTGSTAAFEQLIIEKMQPGFWNEYLSSEKTVFIFKHTTGEAERIELTPQTEARIDKLAAAFVGVGWDKKGVWSWLAENSWYGEIIDTRTTRGLISGLDDIDWPESTKTAQRNWIGRSEGLIFTAPVKDMDITIETFSAHFEACYADTFVAIAPEHPLLKTLVAGLPHEQKVLDFAQNIINERAASREEREPTGIFTGRYIINPLDGHELPIWVASFALANYGTGIVKCSAHDERDFAFAKKYSIPLKACLLPADPIEAARVQHFEYCYSDMQHGILTEPAELAGRRGGDARQAVIDHCVVHGFARTAVSKKLRDWLVSRQRYWGAPIPIIHCETCGEVPVPEEQLPVRLPTDVDFMPTGESPLTNSKSFHDVTCPTCGEKARRESDTMDTFVCSSWYYFAFAEAAKLKAGGNPMTDRTIEEIVNAPSSLAHQSSPLAKWSPVDLYVGGAEHTVLHLLYARFFTKVAHRAGLIDCDEPFAKLRHQGMILAEDGRKMSKSLGNVINPDEVVRDFGADTLRMYEMFMGPFADSVPWNTKGIEGIHRFLGKVWRLFTTKEWESCGPDGCPVSATADFKRMLHTTIKKVTEDTDEFKFNTAVSQMMIFVNFASDLTVLPQPAMEKFLMVLAPYAPHITEELWQMLGHTDSIHTQTWPTWNEKFLTADTVRIVVQVSGKVRDQFDAPAGISQADAFALAREREAVQKWLEGKEIIKEIFVPDKIVGFVI